jgi:hypothetical protein
VQPINDHLWDREKIEDPRCWRLSASALMKITAKFAVSVMAGTVGSKNFGSFGSISPFFEIL